jgi:hypothetical protein
MQGGSETTGKEGSKDWRKSLLYERITRASGRTAIQFNSNVKGRRSARVQEYNTTRLCRSDCEKGEVVVKGCRESDVCAAVRAAPVKVALQRLRRQ